MDNINRRKFIGTAALAGIGLASIVGIILNLILPNKSKPVHFDKDEDSEEVNITEDSKEYAEEIA